MRDLAAESLKAISREGERQLEEHPSPEELVAYQRRRLDESESDRIQGHLALCRECSALYLDLVEMVEEPPEADDGEGARAWPELERRLKQETVETRSQLATRVPSRATRPAVSGSPRFAYALAAVFFACACGLLLWNLGLRRAVDGLSEPQLNVPVHDLASGRFVRTEVPAPERLVRITPGTRRAVLVLNPAEPPAEDSYGLRILDGGGGVVHSASGLVPTPFGNFTLELTLRLFPEERYVLEIHDAAGDVVDRFEVRLERD